MTKRAKPEEIIAKPREVEVRLSRGKRRFCCSRNRHDGTCLLSLVQRVWRATELQHVPSALVS